MIESIHKEVAYPDRDREMIPLFYVYLMKCDRFIPIMTVALLFFSIWGYVETGLDGVLQSLRAFPNSDWAFFTAIPLGGLVLLFLVYPYAAYRKFRKSLIDHYKAGYPLTFTSEGGLSNGVLIPWNSYVPIHKNNDGIILKHKRKRAIILLLKSSFTE